MRCQSKRRGEAGRQTVSQSVLDTSRGAPLDGISHSHRAVCFCGSAGRALWLFRIAADLLGGAHTHTPLSTSSR